MPDYTIENELRESGYSLICGVDEAGRGPLAGPVCAAAVILPKDCEIAGLDDSKKLSEKRREALYDEITKKAVAYCVKLTDNRIIDQINILNATMLTMQNAVEGLSVAPDYVIIDGNKCPEQLKIPSKWVIKGDSLSMSIAAASILAKVTRDRLMIELDRQYPQYQFSKHKGYGTALHCELIRQYGASEIHRMSFLKNILK